jgi:adenylate kinase
MTTGEAARRLAKNLTILGAPGSGKGFYGGPLASFLGVPLWTTSSILRSHSLLHSQRQECAAAAVTASDSDDKKPGKASGIDDMDLASGRLVDCQLVSETLRLFLSQKGHTSQSDGGGCSTSGFVLDGFPRTRRQIDLMSSSWPVSHQVQFCVQLDVPDVVCEEKILGRRHCRVCRRSVNLASVQTLSFDLPPQVPDRATNRCSCDPQVDWTIREDDAAPDIARRRLKTYREHEAPLLDYYRRRGRLLTLTPHRGERDIPDLQRTVQRWLLSFDTSE